MSHQALLYGSADELVEAAGDFLSAGLAAGEPLLVALPAATRALLTPVLPEAATVVAMEDLGRNPARIIPSLRAWADARRGERVRVLGEGCWPGRTADERAEQAVHESLVDLVREEVDLVALCPYDLRRTPGDLLRDVERTHAELCCGGSTRRSAHYGEPLETPGRTPGPAPDDALTLPVPSRGGLRSLRVAVRELAMRAGLGRDRADEALIAVNEAATNALLHGSGDGVVRLWVEDRAVLCEVRGGGLIEDPLAGRRPPGDDSEGGRGLWLVNHLCDLVQVRSCPDGTVVRLRLARA